MKKTVDTFGLDQFMLVADKGMCSGTNMCHVTDAGNGYIVSMSLGKSTAAERRCGDVIKRCDFRLHVGKGVRSEVERHCALVIWREMHWRMKPHAIRDIRTHTTAESSAG